MCVCVREEVRDILCVRERKFVSELGGDINEYLISRDG